MTFNYEWGAGWVVAENAETMRHESYRKALASLPEDQRGENGVQTFASQVYVPGEDVIDTLPDGRCVIACAAGQPMPLAEAQRRGLVDVEGGA